ncbi:MAG: hypothetical protein WA821_18850, partial [Anaerolineales bacterium]
MKKPFFPLLILSVLLAACAAPAAATPDSGVVSNATQDSATAPVIPTDTAVASVTPGGWPVLTVMTHDTFSISLGILQDFEL